MRISRLPRGLDADSESEAVGAAAFGSTYGLADGAGTNSSRRAGSAGALAGADDISPNGL